MEAHAHGSRQDWGAGMTDKHVREGSACLHLQTQKDADELFASQSAQVGASRTDLGRP